MRTRTRRALLGLLIVASTASADILHLKSGGDVTGKLKSCDEEQCFIDSKHVPIDQIAVIELRHVAIPPNVRPRAVILNDGTIARGNFVSLSLGEVDTDAGEIDRDDVALIVLVPPAPVIAQPPPTPQPPPPPGGTGPLWTGIMRARLWGTVDGVSSTLNVTVRVRVREYSFPWLDMTTGKPVGTIRRLRPEGSEVENTMECHGQDLSCSGHGTVNVTYREDDRHPSVIYSKERAGRTDVDVPVGKELYVVAVPAHSDSKYYVTYVSSGTSISPMGYISPMAGRSPVVPGTIMVDPNVRYIENGRMSGSYTAPATGAFEHAAVSWMICREGVACGDAPPVVDGGTPASSPAGSQASRLRRRDAAWPAAVTAAVR